MTLNVYYSLQYPRNGDIGSTTVATWWGNTVFTRNADWLATPLKSVPEGKIFG